MYYSGSLNDFLGLNSVYNNKLILQEGELVYISSNVSLQEATWFEQLGIQKSSDYYMVEFDTAGGTEIATQTIQVGKTAEKPNNPTKEGYIFLGWYYMEQGGTEDNPTYEEVQFDFNTTIMRDYLIHAKYSGEAIMTAYKSNQFFWKYKSDIKTITFTSNADLIPSDIKESWNLKADNDCADIMAYLENNTNALIIYSPHKIYANYNASYYFDSFTKLEEIDFSNFSTEKTYSMAYFFRHCDIIEDLDLNEFNTKNVNSMCAMFSNCKALTNLNLNSFNTIKVKSMYQMFNSCNNIASIELSNFNTENVNNMSAMFSNCWNIESLDLSHFKTENVIDMSKMFGECRNLSYLNICGFNTKNVTNMFGMFIKCGNLITLDLSSFNTLNVTNMSRMISNCSKLTTVYASNNFVTNNVLDSTDMFIGDIKIKGNNGTEYSASYIDKEYAHIDGGEENPGYFTSK